MERSWTLPAAGAVTALENVGVIGALLFLGTAPALVPLFLATKFPFCIGLLQRRHGAFMLLTFWEATVLVIAVLNPAIDLAPRMLLAGSAAAALVLMGKSIPLFPEVRLAETDRERGGPAEGRP